MDNWEKEGKEIEKGKTETRRATAGPPLRGGMMKKQEEKKGKQTEKMNDQKEGKDEEKGKDNFFEGMEEEPEEEKEKGEEEEKGCQCADCLNGREPRNKWPQGMWPEDRQVSALHGEHYKARDVEGFIWNLEDREMDPEGEQETEMEKVVKEAMKKHLIPKKQRNSENRRNQRITKVVYRTNTRMLGGTMQEQRCMVEVPGVWRHYVLLHNTYMLQRKNGKSRQEEKHGKDAKANRRRRKP